MPPSATSSGSGLLGVGEEFIEQRSAIEHREILVDFAHVERLAILAQQEVDIVKIAGSLGSLTLAASQRKKPEVVSKINCLRPVSPRHRSPDTRSCGNRQWERTAARTVPAWRGYRSQIFSRPHSLPVSGLVPGKNKHLQFLSQNPNNRMFMRSDQWSMSIPNSTFTKILNRQPVKQISNFG